MADAQVLYAENTSHVTASSTTWVDVTSISAASFTASKKYLILALGYLKPANASADPRMRLVRGTTPTEFTDAVIIQETNATARSCWIWLYVFDQPATTEAITLQISDSATNTATCELGQIMAIKLSDNFTENAHWYYNEATTDNAFSTALQTGAAEGIGGPCRRS